MTELFDSTNFQDYQSFVQMCHKIVRNKLLNNDGYFEHCCYIAREFADGARPRIIINMPPGFGKTTLFSISMIPWLLAHNPTLRIMLVTHDAALAKEIFAAVRKIIKSAEYKRICGTRIERGYDTIEDFRTTEGGGLIACSIEGGITGRRVDVVIVDDALAIKHAGKMARVEKVNRIFDKEIMTRLSDPTKGRILVAMHRLHKDDLTAHLMQKGGWDRIVHPLVAERDLEYRFGGLVFSRKKGDQLRPGLYTKRKLRELREEEGTPSWRYLYQQGTGPDTDFNIRPKHFPLVDTRRLPNDLPVVFSIDTSQKEGSNCSRNVILVMVRAGKDDIVLDEFCAQTDYVGLHEAFHRLAKKYRPSVVLIEDTSSGSALIAQLKQKAEFEIIPVTPKGPKRKRLRRHARRIRRGRIQLPSRAKWYGDFVGEFVDYPDGPNDRIDALTMYLDYMETEPVLLPASRSSQVDLPAGLGHSRGRLPLTSSSPAMHIPGGVRVLASSVLHPPTLRERPPEHVGMTEFPREPITVFMAYGDQIIRKKI